MLRTRKTKTAFALYEVLLGLTVFVVGILALGRSVENCLNASALSAEDNRVRLILANRMSEIQASSAVPDPAAETKVDTGYGLVRLIQQTIPAQLVEDDGTDLVGMRTVTLTANWVRGGVKQSRSVEFYVYRAG